MSLFSFHFVYTSVVFIQSIITGFKHGLELWISSFFIDK